MTYWNLTVGQVDVFVEVAVFGGKVGYGTAYLGGGDVGIVRMGFGEDEAGLAAVGAEELGDERNFVGAFRGFENVVFGDLDGFAATVPAVGGIIGEPEGVVDALGDTVEGAVFVADAFVSGGLVAEVWEMVLLLLELLPTGGLGGGGDAGVVLGAEPSLIELGVDGGDLVAKIGETAEVAIIVAEGGGDGAEFLIVLGGGETEYVLCEAGEHEMVGGVPVDGSEVVAVATVDTLEEGAGSGVEQIGVMMNTFLLPIDADTEAGNLVGKVGELMALSEITLNGGIKKLTIGGLGGGARGRNGVPGCPY